jgi:hypothetical protein
LFAFYKKENFTNINDIIDYFVDLYKRISDLNIENKNKSFSLFSFYNDNITNIPINILYNFIDKNESEESNDFISQKERFMVLFNLNNISDKYIINKNRLENDIKENNEYIFKQETKDMRLLNNLNRRFKSIHKFIEKKKNTTENMVFVKGEYYFYFGQEGQNVNIIINLYIK